MSKFKVGDRVVFYDGWSKRKGDVLKVGDGVLKVDLGHEYGVVIPHEKQCRKLVKKKRRRVWVPVYKDKTLSSSCFQDWCEALEVWEDSSTITGLIEFVEVRKKK